MKEIKSKFLSLTKVFLDATIKNGLVSLGNSIELPVLFKRLGGRLVFASFPRRVKVPARMHQLMSFCKYLFQMRKHHGSVFVIKYLKACQLAVQKAIAKNPMKSLNEIEPDLPLPRLATSGLPRIIPLRDRRAIMNGHSSCIRGGLTVFSVYRVISIPGQLKLNTITDSFIGSNTALERVDLYMKTYCLSMRSRFSLAKRSIKLLLLETASPSSKSSGIGFARDAYALQHSHLKKPIEAFFDLFDARPEKKLGKACSKVREAVLPIDSYKDSNSVDGQLSIKEEAAGKVRVFALVDVGTQSVLKPLHECLFDFLKSLPNDGTFDQHASVKRASEKSQKWNQSFGYDLSAATDRLPATLQRTILSNLFSEKLGQAWYELLVGRDYVLSHKKYGEHRVRYTVGQPMGALSSGAMLAITHHFLVQYAATLAGCKKSGEWYVEYELLGDDIILFEKVVADQYLSIMEDIGVPINLSKSVVAKNATIEFAKVTFHKGQNVSAISGKMFLSQMTAMGRSNIVFSLLRKDIVKTHVVSGAQNILRRTRGDFGDMKVSLFSILNMMANSRLLSLSTLLLTAVPLDGELSGKAVDNYNSLLKRLDLGSLQRMLAVAARGENVKVSEDRLSGVSWMMYQMSFVQLLTSKVKRFVDTFEVNSEAIKGSKGIMSHLFDSKFKDGGSHLMYMGMRTVENELNVIHNYLYKMKRKDLMSSYDKLKKLIYVNLKSSNIRFLSGNDYEAPIRATPNTMLVNRERDLSEWIEDCLEIDNVRSALELLDRAKAKCLEGGSPEVKESPLSSLSFMEKALKRSSRITETGAIRLSRKQRRKSIVKVDRNLNKVSVPQELDCEPKISFRPKFGFAFAGPKLPV